MELQKLTIELVYLGCHLFDQADTNMRLMLDQLDKLVLAHCEHCAVTGGYNTCHTFLPGKYRKCTKNLVGMDLTYFNAIANSIGTTLKQCVHQFGILALSNNGIAAGKVHKS